MAMTIACNAGRVTYCDLIVGENRGVPNSDWWAGLPPLERTRRAKVEPLWRVWKNGSRWVDCEIRSIDAVGHETRILDTGDLRYSRLWPTHELALTEAADRKADLLAAGWLDRLPTPD
jgi:hypothetical protein